MPIEVVSGVPGSGKTTFVVNLVRGLREKGDRVLLFACRDASEIGPQSSLRRHAVISTRDGQVSQVDHFTGVEETKALLNAITAETTLVFEEAQYFGREFTETWIDLSTKGHRVVLSTPTPAQIQRLRNQIDKTHRMTTNCILMGDGPAEAFFVLPDSQVTLSVCQECATALRERAKQAALSLLIAQEPHPGEPRVYQPIPLQDPEFSALVPIRADCPTRVDIMMHHVRDSMGEFSPRSRTYIDVGCNTGYFCKEMADHGFKSTGVDVVPGDIRVGKLLDAYFYRRYLNLIAEDAVTFIGRDDTMYDVISTFSVFQWIYLQKGKQAAEAALLKLLGQARSLVFFEMGYVAEDHYSGRLEEPIDKEWCLRTLQRTARFSDIVTYDQGYKGLKRDLFVGIVRAA